ncbi:MAG: alpha/beta fold hydrolase [Pseudomonadota bacterium]
MMPLPPSTPAPFDLGTGSPTVVLFHGFTGSPYEVRPLGLALAAGGWRAIGPVLAGHGARPEDLAAASADQVLDGARRVLDTITGPLVLVGFSMGSLVAGLLAEEQAVRVRALVLLSPAARLAPWGEAGLVAVRAGLWRALPMLPKVAKGGDCGDPEGRRRNPCYGVHPTRGLLALDQLARRFRRAQGRVRMPTLVMHGARDRTIPARVGARVASALGARVVERYLLPRSRHLILLDVERDLAVAQVLDFLRRHASPEAS